MSQAGVLSVSTGGGAVVETLTGNSGGAVGPDGAFNINVLGNNTTGINVVGSPGTNTLTITGIQATTTQRGTVTLATNAETIAGTDTSKVITPDDLKAKLGTQTAHSLAVFEGTAAALTALGAATNGQLPIGSTGADPVLGNITSTAGTITVTNGAGTINLDIAGGHPAIEQFIPDSGTNPVLPNGSGQVTMAGSGSTTTVGGLNSLTFQLTGLTNHAVLVGAGTTTITKVGPTATAGQVLQSAGAAADPAFSTATYPLTTTINQILYSSSANTVTGLATANRAVLTTGATGIPVLTALATDGQLIIGSTAGVPAAATLTAGTGISITNGSNSISIAVNGSTVGETITGNSGGALSPTAGNWNILGASTAAGTSPVTTSGAVSTLTINVQKSQAIAATDATKVGLANFDSASFAVDANGFVTASGTGVLKTLTGNSGGAISPTAGNINTVGTGSITIAGAGSTLTTQLTGLTNHALQIGAGTATLTQLGAGTTGQVLQTNTAADPTWSTATYPSTTTVSQILYSSATNTVAGLATANRGVLTTGTTGIPVITALATDGQLIIGSTAGVPAAATLTGGSGITITNASNSITISASGSGLTWADGSGTFTAVSNHGYFITGASTPTLPAAPSNGDVVSFILDTASACTVTGNTGQPIRVGAAVSAAAGTAASNARGDALNLVYRSTTTTWLAESVIGTWTVT